MAISRSSSRAVGPGRWLHSVLAGWKERGCSTAIRRFRPAVHVGAQGGPPVPLGFRCAHAAWCSCFAGLRHALCEWCPAIAAPVFFSGSLPFETRSAKISAPPPGQGIESRLDQFRQHLFQGLLGPSSDLHQLDHGEGLDVDLRSRALYRTQNIEVVRVGKLGVDTRHHVYLGHRLAELLGDFLGHLLGGEGRRRPLAWEGAGMRRSGRACCTRSCS